MPLNLDEKVLRGATRVVLGLPEAIARRVFGEPPRAPEGYVLDATMHRLIAAAKIAGAADATSLPKDEARPAFERSLRLAEGAPVRGLDARDLTLSELPSAPRVRVYRPHVASDPSPAVVFFHGGGFVLGSLDSHNDLCRHIALRARAAVLAVDYRLAPEHPFPAAARDAVDAFRALRARARALGIDPTRMAVAGDSAGGNLAAVSSNALRGDAGPCAQWLIYPGTDFTRSFASHRSFADAPILPKQSIDRFLDAYVPDHATYTNPEASPHFEADLAGVAPAIVQTAGFDALRDEGDAYAQRLRDAGVDVTHRCETTLLHGWAQMAAHVPTAERALAWGCAQLRARLHG